MLRRMAAKEEKKHASTKAAIQQAKDLSDRHDFDQLLITNGILHSITDKDKIGRQSIYAQSYLNDQPTAVAKEHLADWTSTMMDRGAQSLWVIDADEKVSKWRESTVAGPKTGFTDDLKRSLQQLSRAVNSGEKNCQIIHKLVPWFESAGMNNFMLSMYTGNVRFIVTDRTHLIHIGSTTVVQGSVSAMCTRASKRDASGEEGSGVRGNLDNQEMDSVPRRTR